MPHSRTLTTLFEAIGHEDFESLRTSALSIVAEEEAKGNRNVAKRLKGALNGLGGAQPSKPDHQDISQGFILSKALIRLPSSVEFKDIKLRKPLRNKLLEITQQWEARDFLKSKGLNPCNTLLFSGPPGCGKTITASSLAKLLGMPAYAIRFDGLIGQYLGQTAVNLREVFNYAASTKCVIVLDEIDVLGKARGNQMDIGELDRIVVGLMQELDYANPRGLIIGASNLTQQLDKALWRRFDMHFEFPRPSKSEGLTFARGLAKEYGIKLSEALRKAVEKQNDYASIDNLVSAEARRKLLKHYLSDAGEK